MLIPLLSLLARRASPAVHRPPITQSPSNDNCTYWGPCELCTYALDKYNDAMIKLAGRIHDDKTRLSGAWNKFLKWLDKNTSTTMIVSDIGQSNSYPGSWNFVNSDTKPDDLFFKMYGCDDQEYDGPSTQRVDMGDVISAGSDRYRFYLPYAKTRSEFFQTMPGLDGNNGREVYWDSKYAYMQKNSIHENFNQDGNAHIDTFASGPSLAHDMDDIFRYIQNAVCYKRTDNMFVVNTAGTVSGNGQTAANDKGNVGDMAHPATLSDKNISTGELIKQGVNLGQASMSWGSDAERSLANAVNALNINHRTILEALAKWVTPCREDDDAVCFPRYKEMCTDVGVCQFTEKPRDHHWDNGACAAKGVSTWLLREILHFM